jgi:hypothetical protein
MLNATAARAVLGALVLVCAPAIAIIPPSVEIRLGGAEQTGLYSYRVHEGDAVALAVKSQPGDLIWAFAVALDKNGEADYSAVVTLLFDQDCKTGQVSGAFKIPAGLAGQKFQLEAVALSDKGEISWSTSLIVDVAKVVADDAHLSTSSPLSDL